MTPVFMQVQQSPANNQYGDCMRACIASLLDAPPERVPHFAVDNPGGAIVMRRINSYLGDFGMSIFGCAYTSTDGTIQPVLDIMQFSVPETYYMVGGFTRQGDDDSGHAMVAFENKIVHDPYGGEKPLQIFPDSNGLVHVFTVTLRCGNPPRAIKSMRRVSPKSD